MSFNPIYLYAYIKKECTVQEFNKSKSENFTARFKQANLASKNYIANFIKQIDFDNKLQNVTSNKNKLNELSKFIPAAHGWR